MVGARAVKEVPHRGHENDFREGAVAAEFLEHLKIFVRGAGHADVGDAVQVNDACQLDSLGVDGAKEEGDVFEDVGIGTVGVVEAGGIDEADGSAIMKIAVDSWLGRAFSS